MEEDGMKPNFFNKTDIVIGIDALRAKSGGARTHLVGILSELVPGDYGIIKVHVWSYPELLDQLPDSPWLIKHCPPAANAGIIKQLLWQFFSLPDLLRGLLCDIVLNLDAATVNRFTPSVTMSRDMLSYEQGEMERYKYSRSWIRLLAIKYVQAWSLKRASTAVFLTKYASDVIQEFTGELNRFCYIPHGVGSAFLDKQVTAVWPETNITPITCIYVSNLAPYKHQWVVIEALKKLRSQGYNLSLKLVGDNNNVYMDLVDSVIQEGDMEWIELLGHTDPALLPDLIAQSNVFIFASSCENMPNSLVEAMAVGLPIACSDRGPMPEILCDGGLYFDPENHHSIASCVERIISDEDLREQIAIKANFLAQRYSWERCRDETFLNLITTLEKR